MLHMMIRLLLLVQLIAWASPADAQQRFTQNPISLQRAAGADGDGSAITTKGYLSVALQVTGTFTATVNFEGTADSSTWVALKCVNVATDGRVTTLTAAGMVQCNVQGMTSLRARVSGWSDGTVTVTGYLMDVVLGSTSDGVGVALDTAGNVKTTLVTTLAGEDVLNDVQKTEERYLTIPIGGTDAMVAADQLYKSGPGYVRSITCYSDATATAGTIALRDNTAAGAGKPGGKCGKRLRPMGWGCI